MIEALPARIRNKSAARCIDLSVVLLLVLSVTTSKVLADCPAAGTSVQTYAFAAGCLIRQQDRILAVRHRFSGKLGVPAGLAERGEAAPCTAQRETLEEAGMEVAVGGLLREFDNGFHLYRCRLIDSIDVETPLRVPTSGWNEIWEVLWLDPASTPGHEWRFPEQWPAIMKLFNAM